MHFGLVDFCQDMWRSVRDPYRKKKLAKIVGGEATGRKKSRDAGATIAQQADSWQYYQKMSFLRPFLYIRE